VPYSPPPPNQPASGSNLAKSPGFVPRDKVISPVMSISRLLSDSSEQQGQEQPEMQNQQPGQDFAAQPPRSSAFHATNPVAQGYSTNQDVERSSTYASMSSTSGPMRHNGINDLLNHGSDGNHRSSQSSETTNQILMDPKVRTVFISRKTGNLQWMHMAVYLTILNLHLFIHRLNQDIVLHTPLANNVSCLVIISRLSSCKDSNEA
jgi:hypothetical protein